MPSAALSLHEMVAVQRLCNHKTGIHEVIVLEFEIRTACRDKSNIDFVLGQYRK